MARPHGRIWNPPLRFTQKFVITARFFGVVKPPPYGTNEKENVGANSVRPGSLAVAQDPAGTAKPPLCKGRWHGVSRDGGIGACVGELSCFRKVTIPQSALRLTAPFTQGSL